MKAMAARQEADGEDLRVLAADLGITSHEQALDLVERHYGAGRLSPKTSLILQALLSEEPDPFDENDFDLPAEPQQPRGGPGSKQYQRKPRRH